MLGVRSSQSRAERGQDCHRLIYTDLLNTYTCRAGQKYDETSEMRGLAKLEENIVK